MTVLHTVPVSRDNMTPKALLILKLLDKQVKDKRGMRYMSFAEIAKEASCSKAYVQLINKTKQII